MIYFEAEFDNGGSICCRGKRLPTIAEANIFCAADVKINGEVVSVVEISAEEANLFFDTDNIDAWPIFK